MAERKKKGKEEERKWEEGLKEESEEEEPYHMTVGDLRELILKGHYDMVNPDKEVGICYYCGGLTTLLDVAESDYDDETFVEEATDVLCSQCRGEGAWE